LSKRFPYVGRPKRLGIVRHTTIYVYEAYRDVFEKILELADREGKSFSEMMWVAAAEYVSKHYPGNPQLPLFPPEDLERYRLQADEMEASKEAAYLRYVLPRIRDERLGGEVKAYAWESAVKLARLNRKLRRRRYYRLVEEARKILEGG